MSRNELREKGGFDIKGFKNQRFVHVCIIQRAFVVTNKALDVFVFNVFLDDLVIVIKITNKKKIKEKKNVISR